MSYQVAWSFVVMASVVLFVVALRADERELRRKFSEYGKEHQQFLSSAERRRYEYIKNQHKEGDK